MNALLNLGRYLYALPFLVFGVFHFMRASSMAAYVPIPGGEIWVYITGLAHILAAISITIGKFDKLGAFLLGLMLLIFALSIHLPGSMSEDPQMAQSQMTHLLKNLSLVGGAWIYARYASVDPSGLGA